MTVILRSVSDYIRRAMESYKGDNLERATRAFAGLSDKQMGEQYGQSGKTCREILDEYRVDRDTHYAAMDALRQAGII
jgi:hypothetical protein